MAVVVVGISLALRLMLIPLWGPTAMPFTLFFPAIVVAAWYGRLGPAIVSTALSGAAVAWFFMAPAHSFILSNTGDVLGLISYLAVGCCIAAAIEAMHSANSRAFAELAGRQSVNASLRASEARERARAAELEASMLALQRKTELLQAIIDRIPAMICVAEPGRAEMQLNAEFQRLAQWPMREALPDELLPTLYPDESYREQVRQFLAAGGEGWRDLQFRARDGRIVDSSWASVRLSTGTSVAIGIDMTRHKEADARLRLREEQLRFVTDHAEVMIVQCDARGYYTFVNKPFAARYGHMPDEVVGRHIAEVVGLEAYEILRPFVADALQGRRVEFEIKLPYRHIAPRWTNCVWVPQTGADGAVTGFVAVIQDISARKETEAALRESEVRFRSMADGLPLLVWLQGPDDQQPFVNRTFCEFFGVTAPEISGGRWQLLLHPDDQAFFRGEFLACLDARRPFHAEARVRRADGEWRWLESWGWPRLTETGGLLGMVGASVDITERKQAEQMLEATRDKALAASRAKDDFIALLSHELRTPLSPVLLIATEAARDPALPAQARADFELIAQNVALEARLIDDLLDMSRITRGKVMLERETLDLNAVVRDAVRGVEEEAAGKPLSVSLSLDTAPAPVLGDPVRLRQVFWNVLKNAVKFTPPGGRIELTSTHRADGQEVEVAIRDTGIGMTPAELLRVFEPFAQGEHAREGTSTYGGLGLGLTIVRTLVERHGGSVSAQSPGPSQGTVVFVRLPLLSTAELPLPAAAVPAPELPAAEPGQPALRVLLVEDHPATRQAMALMLQRRGLRVTAAGSLAEARRCVAGERFDVLVSDLGLPDGDGCALLAELRAGGLDLPGVAITGYGMEADFARSRAAGFGEHITKPVTIQALERALARLLHDRTRRN